MFENFHAPLLCMYAAMQVAGEPLKAHDDLAIIVDPVAISTHKENNLEVASGLDKVEMNVVEVKKTKPCP